jgi:hypothetical protein
VGINSVAHSFANLNAAAILQEKHITEDRRLNIKDKLI